MSEGYIAIDNDIFDSILKLELNGSELRIVLMILKYTLGFHRDTHKMTAEFIADGLNIPLVTVKRSLKSLAEKNIIILQRQFKGINYDTLGIKKGIENDTLENKKGIKNDTLESAESIKNDTLKVSKMIPKKEKYKESTCTVHAPNFSEVAEYFSSHGYGNEVARNFFDYNEALDWSVHGQPIKKWKVFADRWMKKENTYGGCTISPTLTESETDIWGKPIKPDWE